MPNSTKATIPESRVRMVRIRLRRSPAKISGMNFMPAPAPLIALEVKACTKQISPACEFRQRALALLQKINEETMPAAGELSNRRWARLTPVVFITYSLAYVDRANFGLGAAGGMAADLHISGEQNSLLGALFFLGYALFQIPVARLSE